MGSPHVMLELTLYPDEGEPIEVDVDSRDVVKWERQAGRAFTELLVGMTLESVYAVALIAARRRRLEHTDTPEGFEEAYAVDVGRAEPPDPTPPAPSIEPPSDSQ